MLRKKIVSRVWGMLLLALMFAFGARADKVRGMIMARSGETMIVNASGERRTVVLSAATRVKDDKGLFGLDKEEMADTVLIPGLKVRVDGSSDSQGQLRARTI